MEDADLYYHFHGEWGEISEGSQRVDNSDDTSEVLAAADEYFSIQQEGC